MRAIDANKVEEDIKDIWCWVNSIKDDGDEYEHDIGMCGGLLLALRIVSAAPTIEPKRGEWVTVWDECGENENGYECSECGAEADEKFPNCPYCRARMKG